VRNRVRTPARRRRRLAITVAAKFDIDNILLYTQRQWGAGQRRRYRAQLYQGMRGLLDYPERGRPRDELYAGCRSVLVEHHVVYYYLTDDAIVIDRVLHGSEDTTGKVTP
jgi:toxin ParE1/3/4